MTLQIADPSEEEDDDVSIDSCVECGEELSTTDVKKNDGLCAECRD